MSASPTVEKHEFQAEVRQVLDLMIHSLYSNKEIFLRELISNASDACDKLRFEALQNDSLYEGDGELKITIAFDKEARTLSIADNGIGMSRQELIDNIGTIARSGTRKFLESLSGDQKSDAQLIGQFGVGFYSAFIVADKVTVNSRRAGTEQAVQWISEGDGEYTLADIEKAGRGTEIILHLKEDEDQWLESFRLKSLVTTYSDHIGFPILMPKEASEDEDSDGSEWETINKASALWTLPKNEISEEDYQSFYKHLSHDFNDPLSWTHNKVEGNQSYTSLLYLPAQAPFDLYMNRDDRQGLKLYVKRVFIMDAAEQLLPHYLRFVRGVIDSDDLPLNVSRELLQENALVKKIRAGIVKRTLDQLGKLANQEKDNYQIFWDQFGQVLKEGMGEDISNQEKLSKLLRFASTAGDEGKQTISLEEYVNRMKPEQDAIYYITAENAGTASNSPHLEIFRKNNIEVLLLSDRVDEWMMGYFREFDGKPLKSIAKGDIDLEKLEDEDSRKQREEAEKEASGLVERIKAALGDSVDEVKVSQRLTDSPACLVLNEHEMAMHLQRLLKQAGQEMPGSKPHLEINVTHPILKRMEGTEDKETFESWSQMLLEQAILAEGGQLDDPARFVQRLNRLLLS